MKINLKKYCQFTVRKYRKFILFFIINSNFSHLNILNHSKYQTVCLRNIWKIMKPLWMKLCVFFKVELEEAVFSVSWFQYNRNRKSFLVSWRARLRLISMQVSKSNSSRMQAIPDSHIFYSQDKSPPPRECRTIGFCTSDFEIRFIFSGELSTWLTCRKFAKPSRSELADYFL